MKPSLQWKAHKVEAISFILLIIITPFASSVLHVSDLSKDVSAGADRATLQSHPVVSHVANSTSLSPQQLLSLGTLTGGAVYSPANGYIYVGEVLKPAVAVVNTLNGTVITEIKLVNYGGTNSASFAMVYDQQDKSIYAGIDGAVAVINTTSNTLVKEIGVPGGGQVYAMAEDPQTRAILIAEPSPSYNEIIVINTSTNVITRNITITQSATGLAYDPVSKTVFISGSYGALYGLNASDYSFSKNTSFGAPIYSLLYAFKQNSLMLGMASSNVYVVNPSTLSIENKIYAMLNPFVMTLDPIGGFLYISDANNISADIESINISNQSQNFFISSQGFVLGILWDSGSGQICVTGASGGVIILPGSGSTGTYAVQFAEKSLSAGRWWSINVSGLVERTRSGDTMGFFLSAGDYLYEAFSSGYFAEGALGESVLSVSTGNESILVIFSKTAYPVLFHGTGLKKGIPWTVAIERVVSGSGVVGSSNATSGNPRIEFNLTNGTYAYFVLPVKGYYVNKTSGELNITGSNVSVQLRWRMVEPPFLYRDVFGVQIFIWIQFIEVAAIVAGTILSGRLVRRFREKK